MAGHVMVGHVMVGHVMAGHVMARHVIAGNLAESTNNSDNLFICEQKQALN